MSSNKSYNKTNFQTQTKFSTYSNLGEAVALDPSYRRSLNPQKRELKYLLIKKYINKFANRNLKNAFQLAKIIEIFVHTQNINEQNLKKLEQNLLNEQKLFAPQTPLPKFKNPSFKKSHSIQQLKINPKNQNFFDHKPASAKHSTILSTKSSQKDQEFDPRQLKTLENLDTLQTPKPKKSIFLISQYKTQKPKAYSIEEQSVNLQNIAKDETIKSRPSTQSSVLRKSSQGKRPVIQCNFLKDQIPGYPDINDFYNLDDDAQSFTSSLTTKSIYKTTPKDKDEWTILMHQDINNYQKEANCKELEKKEKMKKMKMFLDLQVEEKRKQMDEEKEETKKFVEFQNLEMEKFDKVQEEELRKVKEMNQKQKQFFQLQIMDQDKKKKRQLFIEKKFKQQMQKRFIDEKNQEENMKKQKKLKEYQRFQKLIQDGIVHKEQQKEQEIKDKEQDIQTELISSEILNQRKLQRDLQHQKRMEYQDIVFKRADVKSLSKIQRLKKERQATLVLKYENEKQQEFNQKEQQKIDTVNQLKNEVQTELKRQVSENLTKKIQEKIENEKQAEFWKEDARKFWQEEADSVNKKKDMCIRNQQDLKTQLSEKENFELLYRKMNQEEYLNNKDSLKNYMKNQSNFSISNSLERALIKQNRLI